MTTKKNRKWLGFISCLLFGIPIGIYFLLGSPLQKKTEISHILTKEKTYFIPLKICNYSSFEVPCLEITVEDKPVTVKVDLGYGGTISFPREIIDQIDKKTFIERIWNYGIRGKKYEKNVYAIEKIKMENVSFFPLRIEEQNQEQTRDAIIIGEQDPSESNFGKIGWHLFYQFNLLVDCKHDLFALCDSLDSLKREGYLVNFFTEAPVVFDHGFIEFEAMTEAGLLHCILDTGATWNFLNKDLENEHNEATFIANKKNENLLFSNPENKDLLNFDFKETKMISSFKIGENEFGPLTFNYIRSPIPIDVILGMEFFHSHLVFIDFGNQKVYFYAYPEDPEEI